MSVGQIERKSSSTDGAEGLKRCFIKRQIQHMSFESQLVYVSNRINQANKILDDEPNSASRINDLKKRVPNIKYQFQVAIKEAAQAKESLILKLKKYQRWRMETIFEIAFEIYESGQMSIPEGLILSLDEKTFLLRVLQSLDDSIRVNESLKEKQFAKLSNSQLYHKYRPDEVMILGWLLQKVAADIVQNRDRLLSHKSGSQTFDRVVKEVKSLISKVGQPDMITQRASDELKSLLTNFLQTNLKKQFNRELTNFFRITYSQLIIQSCARDGITSTDSKKPRTFLYQDVTGALHKLLQ